MTMILSGPIIHSTKPLTILGGDPGADTGVVLVHFPERKRDGTPLWLGAKIHGAACITKRDRAGATHAENDILYRRAILETLQGFPFKGYADIVALEEPLDGGGIYRAKPGQGQNEASHEKRETGFRLGAYYAALLAAAATATSANRYVSFPVRSHRDRRGWMKGKRADTLRAGEALLRSLMTREGYRDLQGKRKTMPEHIFMALGVVAHLVDYYLEYFPREAS